MARRPRLYWVYLEKQVRGPWAVDQITGLPGVGERTRVCPEDSTEWTTLGELMNQLAAKTAAPEGQRRCPNCGRRAAPDAKFCAHCGTGIPEVGEAPPAPSDPGPAANRRAATLGVLALVALVLGAGAWYFRKADAARREARRPTGKVRFLVTHVVHARALRDVRGEERTPLPGKRFCLVTLTVRNPDDRPALFNRKELRWEAGGKAVEIDGLTDFLPRELIHLPQLEPGAALEGRVLFQVPVGADRFKLFYGADEIPVPVKLLEDEKRWRGQEEAAVRLLKAYKCKGADGETRDWEEDVDMEPQQELGSLYHVDAEDYSFHVDLAARKIVPAPDVDTLVTENTRRDCFQGR